LKAAWRALGQEAGTVEAASEVAALLEQARGGFDPLRIPHSGRIALAATHNEGFIFAS
jgi:hypothetical protein